MSSSGRPFVTVDLGNTRVKLCAWRLEDGSPRRIERGDLALGPDLAARVYAWFRSGSAARGVELAALSSVAAPAVEANLVELLEELSEGRLEAAPDVGLRIDCRAPETVGRDRLYAARAALELARAPALCVDAGTALTVDAVTVAASGTTAAGGLAGVFLGGAIAPGPRLLAEALARGAARLPAIEPRPGVPALGDDTVSAMQAGVAVGFRGAARELVRCVAREAGLEQAPVFVTGGARHFLDARASFAPHLVREEEDLVHLGLLSAARAQARLC